MFNLQGMGSNAWNLAKWSMTGSRAAPWLRRGAIGLGIGGALGMINPNRSTLGGIGTTLGTTLGGMKTGALVGGLAGAGMMSMNAYRAGILGSRAGLRWVSAGAGRYGGIGMAMGGLIGAGFGLLKAGLTGNRPVNRIRGLHQ